MDATRRTSSRPVLVPATLAAALLLGLMARISGEPVFGAVGTALLVVAVAAGASEALGTLHSVYPLRYAYLVPATTALGLYAAAGGIPHVAAIALVGVSLIAGTVGESKAWPGAPVVTRRTTASAESATRAEAA